MGIYEIELERCYEMLKGHELEVVQRGEKVQAFYLRERPGDRSMSTLILFTPEGIVLQGDLTPERNGVCSALGYGLPWFAGRLDSSYLAEKFLSEKWVLDLAKENLKLEIEDMYRSGDYTEVSEWRIGVATFTGVEPDALQIFAEEAEEWSWFSTWSDFSRELPAYRVGNHWVAYDSEFISAMGMHYDPHEVGLLAAIQRRFSEEIDTAVDSVNRLSS